MNSKLTIKIKKRSQPQWLILFIVFFPFLYGVLFDAFRLPWALKYSLDIAWLFLTLLIIINFSRKNIIIPKKHRIVLLIPVVFFIFVSLVYIFKYQSVFYFLWGIRNNFRFYFAFLAFTIFLTKEDLDDILSFLDKIFIFNAVVTLFQYFLLGKRHDYLGGVFGVEKGCNSYLYIFLVFMTVKSVVYYLNKKSSLLSLMAVCGTSLFLSALAELKFFYIQFALIVFIAVMITDFSWRKLLLIGSGIIGVFLALNLLIYIYPYFGELFSAEAILESVSSGGYSGENQVNRLTTIPVISKHFLDSGTDKMFGLGLGNCDTANIDFLNTPFFREYSYLRYNWFSTSMLYLETGYIGLALFFVFFIAVFVFCIRTKNISGENKTYYNFSAVMATCAILIAVYNSSLRTEAGFLIYFSICFPFVLENKLSINNLVDT